MQLEERPDKLMEVLGKKQGLMRKIQSMLVPRAIALLGLRFSSSVHRAHIGPIAQRIVVEGHIGGISTDEEYLKLKAANMKGDFHFLQHLQQTQYKTAKQHRDKMQELVAALFEKTNDPMVAGLKQDVFDVPDGEPIVNADHEVMAQMMDLPGPAGIHPSPHT